MDIFNFSRNHMIKSHVGGRLGTISSFQPNVVTKFRQKTAVTKLLQNVTSLFKSVSSIAKYVKY